MTPLMLGSALLWTLTVATLSAPVEKLNSEEVVKDGDTNDPLKLKHEKMQKLLQQSQEREQERVKMFHDKEETMKAKNAMFDQRENDLDKMLNMKEKLIDKKEHDFERETAKMEREQEDEDREPDSDSDGSSFLESRSRWRAPSSAQLRAERKFESMSAAVARKQANNEEDLKHLDDELDGSPSSFAQVGELPTFPKEFAKLAEDQTLQNDDEAVQDDQKNVDEKFEELKNTLKQMEPAKAVAEDEAKAELDEDDPSSFLQTGEVAPDYGMAYLQLLAKGGVEKHYKEKATAASARAKAVSAAADAALRASDTSFQQMVKDNEAQFTKSMKPDIEEAATASKEWDSMMDKKRTEAAAQKLASSFIQERVVSRRGDDDADDDELKKVEEKALESAEDMEDIDKKIKAREVAEVKGEHLLEGEIKQHEAKAAKILQSEPDLLGNLEKNLRDDEAKDDGKDDK